MCKALVVIGDQHWDRTLGKPLHGDVLALHPDTHVFGAKELEGRRVAQLAGTEEDWLPLLAPGGEADTLPLYRAFYLDDADAVQRRPTTPTAL